MKKKRICMMWSQIILGLLFVSCSTQPKLNRNNPVDPGAANYVPLRNLFITSSKYNGNLGGSAGADSKCVAAALAAGLEGDWMAWISTFGSIGPYRVIDSNSAWSLVGTNNIIFDEWTQLLAGPNDPINRDEYGNVVPIIDLHSWTGLAIGGAPSQTAAASSTCNDWTTTTGQGIVGNGAFTSHEWLSSQGGPVTNCTEIRRIFCFET